MPSLLYSSNSTHLGKAQQQSDENEHPKSANETLTTVLGKQTGYFHGKRICKWKWIENCEKNLNKSQMAVELQRKQKDPRANDCDDDQNESDGSVFLLQVQDKMTRDFSLKITEEEKWT
ncbi:hypothetical protein HAX54_032411 [Datura stramonium]|uniref:Uncharacterized protein n=1 Tax=Datura stramonium TaxID=4076 RepID=A0ABS8SCT7_DATST|nr:hypothetical protein [Datura stramonium]